MNNTPSFIPTDSQGRPVAKPWIEWEPMIQNKAIERLREDIKRLLPNTISATAISRFFETIDGEKERGRQWLQSPFSPEKDLVGENKVFEGWKPLSNWAYKFPSGWTVGFSNPSTYFDIGGEPSRMADIFTPKTRSEFIEVFKIITGEYLPLTEKAVKELGGEG